jgi:CTP:molybdopterin cytidylyltransferase MocA
VPLRQPAESTGRFEVRAGAVILAAGAGSRFGGGKLRARLDGRPLLDHVLAAARAVPLDPIVLVVGSEEAAIVGDINRTAVNVVRNPDPARGLSSSLRLGVDAIARAEPPVDLAVILLGDQPLVRPDVVLTLLDVAAGPGNDPARPVTAPRYADGGGGNPVVLARSAFDLASEASGDRGLGPVLAAHPALVREVDVPGVNPDVDTAADLRALVEAAWAERVRANREQVERFRERPDGVDFYAPVSAIFRDDPDRVGDPVVDALRALARPGDTWLDIGAGAGRYALPLARVVREVVAVDPSPGMLATLQESMAEHGIANVRSIEGRWPPDPTTDDGRALAATLGPSPLADVSLIAHVSYDIDAIGPFVDAMEAAARRACVAVLMERTPASIAAPFWPDVHGEARIALPALSQFRELLAARGSAVEVTMVPGKPRRWRDVEELRTYLRRQLWVAPGSPADMRLAAAMTRRASVAPADGSVGLATETAFAIGIVSWSPPAARPQNH